MNDKKGIKAARFRYSTLTWLISCQVAMMLGTAGVAQAREFFNPALLEIDNPAQAGADLSVFEDGAQAPGKYRVDVYLNNEVVDTRDVEFTLQPDAATGRNKLQPCFSVGELEALGVRVNMFPALKTDSSCVNVSQAIPQSSANFIFNQQRLDVSIPQAALNVNARGYVSPDKWEEGIPALLTNYSFSGANSKGRKDRAESTNSYYLNLRSGINLGAWRLRNYSTWNRNNDGESHWKSINTYLQRDIIALKSQLVMGDTTTPSDVFDSVPLRGALMYSDDDMLPDSMKGYSPVVRGIARSNAQVTIRQNGYVIYQSYVPPGPFEIKDLFPTAGSGDLYVVIKESDGSEQNLTVAYASVPVLQREGRLKYSLSSGQYRSSNSNVDDTPFTQGTAMYGLPWGATIYGGVQAASKYQSLALGWGQNLGVIGAISADVTQAWSKLKNERKEDGQSWRVRYGKNFADLGTNFSLASYRYSTEGYYSMQETLDSYNNTGDINYYNHKKSRAEMTISQNLGQGFGSFTLSGIHEEYWNSSRKTESLSVGYNNSWEGISYGMNYTYSKNGYDSYGDRINVNDSIFSFNVSVPLSKWMPKNNYAYARYNLNTSKNGNTTNTVGVYGSLLEDNNLRYNVNQGYTSQGGGASGNASLNYQGGQGNINVGYNYSRNQQQVTYGLEGGILIHENGLTLSQPMSETAVLIKAPGASGARITNNTGVTTDWRGYAVVPYATPYRKKEISINTETLGDDVDMTITTQSVIPSRGAIARANFSPNVGQRVLMTLLRGGQPVPFGAVVTDTGNAANNGSIVGDGGQVYMSGMSSTGTLNVKWGTGASQQCQVTYSLPAQDKATGIQMINGDCR
ncbi:fimbria/pilus outer membrane usher protein [Enterobacillus tribolii]|uniref:Outer membrane usher protein n=1 Tax=Enterobacillus tribolii TaxID=1487935 RepID=A0A370QQM3_9GAMM|nr:fimbria/pilus outer membrane usher protein [Enterobacillus tribolii]MBW7981707.1 fimbrial biogenesis outer membrane usher protein [Enterobacillus tribolii]RDK91086.1 outer membrane usher protein [Enterobacillus tribolii]